MKCFLPVCAIALALAASTDLAAGTACAVPCTATDGSCSSADAKTTPLALNKPSTLTCATGKFAYIKTLKIQASTETATATAASAIKVSFSSGAVTTANTATPASVDTTALDACDNSYINLGLTTATADTVGAVTCATAPCTFNYKVEWDCQAPDSCAKQTGTAAPTTQPTKAAAAVLTRPTTDTACATGYYAYLSALYLGADTGADMTKVAVTFTSGTANTAVTSTALKTTCDSQWTDVGKADTLGGDVKINVACSSDTATDCAIKYKATWTCKTATTTATPTTTTATPTTTTATPTTTTSGSTATSVAVWSSAVVTAMAGANLL